jgi:hypothetical protein
LKKGVINLAIKIDYDEMITEETISALQGFTGKTSFEEIANDHMKKLGDQIIDILENKPFLAYELAGDLVPVDEIEKRDVKEIVEEETPVEETPVEEEVLDEMPAEESLITIGKAEKIIKKLDDDIENVSMEKGIPQLVKVNGTVYKAIEELAGDKHKKGNTTTLSAYKGFPILLEGMSEWYEIEYKSYMDNSIDSYVRLGDE